jgi:large subunit ribosomal protein L28
MSRHCQLTGKKANNSVTISFSHKRHKRLQHVNLQWKRIWWPEGNRFVTLHISTKAIKTLQKKSLSTFAKEAGIDLNKF